MELKPAEPPGHAKRKLRMYVSEISRLRAEGYTIRVIHQTLLDAGVKVGWATVQREAARLKRAPSSVQTADEQAAGEPTAKRQVSTTPSRAVPTVEVDKYFDQHATNPLFRKRGKG